MQRQYDNTNGDLVTILTLVNTGDFTYDDIAYNDFTYNLFYLQLILHANDLTYNSK